MSLLKSLRDVFSADSDRTLTGPDKFSARADSETDGADMFAGIDTRRQANVDGLVLGLTYEDTEGNVSQRMVRVHAIGPSEQGDYVHGFCQLREAERTFFIDRVTEVIDYWTGKTHTDAREFFQPYIEIARWRDVAEPESDSGESTPTQQVLTAVRDELKIVLYVAYADGDFQIDEQNVISDYVRDRAAQLGRGVKTGYDHKRIMDWVRNMHPDYLSFERAIKRIAKRDDTDIVHIWHTCKELVMADREIAPREVDAMDALFVEIRKAGISTPLS